MMHYSNCLVHALLLLFAVAGVEATESFRRRTNFVGTFKNGGHHQAVDSAGSTNQLVPQEQAEAAQAEVEQAEVEEAEAEQAEVEQAPKENPNSSNAQHERNHNEDHVSLNNVCWLI